MAPVAARASTRILDLMVWMFVWLGLTLGVAAVVFLVASVCDRCTPGSALLRRDRRVTTA